MNVYVHLVEDISIQSEVYTRLIGQKNTNEARLPISYAFSVEHRHNQQLRSSRIYKTAAFS